MEQITENMSKHLGVPYIYLPEQEKFVCANGVVFTKEEYLNGTDLEGEYARREADGEIYDYAYARSTGLLRKKAVHRVKEAVPTVPEAVAVAEVRMEAVEKPAEREKTPVSVLLMCVALMLTSFGSMYISTVHTATYLLDYADAVSAWLMSTVITVYCATAFEVVLLFSDRKRYVLSAIFAFLWLLVIMFSMTTTVSIFYDRYNFSVVEAQAEDAVDESSRVQLSLLEKKEEALREAIGFKKKDIEYRQERDYATSAVRLELKELEEQLQENLAMQEELIAQSPQAVSAGGVKKEKLLAFMGRMMGLEGGLLEFIMSTLSAVFINLISPFSVSVVVSLMGGMKGKRRLLSDKEE